MRALLLSGLLLSLACTISPSPPRLATGTDAEITHDGLHRVENVRRFQRVWMKPGTDLGEYSKLIVTEVGVRYQRPPSASRREFPLTDQQRENLRGGLRDAISEELNGDPSWEITTDRSPEALVLRASLIDVVVTAPPRQTGRDRVYTSSAGEATLVVELFDSDSLEVLARIADRRGATLGPTSWRSDSINNRGAARRLFREWARQLRIGLDAARTRGPLDAIPDSPDAEPSAGTSG